MAPSNVFSYFRPHHRRNHSNPSSPDLTSLSTGNLNAPHHEFSPPSRVPDDGTSNYSESPISPRPPTLPSIHRVSSAYGQSSGEAPPPPPKSPVKEKSKVNGKKIDQGKDVIKEGYGLGFTWESGNTVARKPLPNFPSGHTSSQGPGHGSDGITTGYGHTALYGMPASSKSTYPPPSISSGSAFGGDRHTQKSPSMESSQPQKSTRGRLNLLNPMSLLMRRRSSQALQSLSNDSTQPRGPIVPAMTMPDDYDPRIRGNRVHDFSAPRPQRTTPPVDHSFAFGSSSRVDGSEGQRGSADSSPSKVDYAPAFKENFDDELRPQELDRAVRAEQLANKKFLQRASFQPLPPDRTPPLPPSQTSETTSTIIKRRSVPPPADFDVVDQELPRPLSPVEEAGSPSERDTTDGVLSKSPEKSPPITRSRATSTTDPNFQPSGIPTHTTSKASRFSFQILGNDSAAQEKLLEERHKQKAAARALAEGPPQKDGEYADEDFDEDAMYEDMMNDYDDFEEAIPGMDDDEIDYDSNPNPSNSTIPQPTVMRTQYTNPLSPISAGGESFDTPGDAYDEMAGMETIDSLGIQGLSPQSGLSQNNFPTNIHSQPIPSGFEVVDQLGDRNKAEDTVTSRVHDSTAVPDSSHLSHHENTEFLPADESDDLYFDDGMIDDPQDMGEDHFDESVFDDPSNPLYERPPPVPKPASLDFTTLAAQPSVLQNVNLRGAEGPITDTVADLENLNAYHSALASAANRAQADGRFNRQSSIDLTNVPNTLSPSHSQSDGTSSSRPSLVPDDGRFSTSTMAPFSPTSFGLGTGFPVEEDYTYNDFDSSLEDDPMIAEANADVLAYDSDEDYGQEFGFYASASSQGESTFYNGGYFGSRDQMLGRSTSGRNAVREPNLTPITERSEYSTRNSFISISSQQPWHAVGVQPNVASPGLAQLARMSPFGFPEDDSDISLEKLMKLRRDAFGGSSGSIGSNNSSPRNSLPGDAMARLSGSGLVNGSNWIPWDLDSSPAHGTSNGDSPDGVNSSMILEQEEDGEDDQEALDTINALGASDSDEFEPRTSGSRTSIHAESSDDAASDFGTESPTLTNFDPSLLQSTPNFINTMVPTNSYPEGPRRPKLQIPLDEGIPGHQTVQCSTSLSSVSVPQLPSLISPLSPMSPFASSSSFAQFGLIAASPASPAAVNGGGTWKTHSRKVSAADSVTYVREKNENGEQQWVLERRRTASTGEMELVGREIVEGGRI